MKNIKTFGLGVCLLIILTFGALIKGDIRLITAYSGVAGVIFLMFAALFSGAFVEPDSRRVDTTNEGMEQLNRRVKWSTWFLLVSLPNLITCIVTFFLMN
ncbi:DUF5316 domain-containing protein [Microbacteriaceae bacterium 4G12]